MNRGIGFQIRCLDLLLRRCMERSPAKYRLDNVTGLHGYLILYLYEHRKEEICQHDLEREFKMRRSTLSATLQLMEKNGAIRRAEGSRDRRLKILSLTEQGADMALSFTREFQEIEQAALEGIDPRALSVCESVLQKITENLEKMEHVSGKEEPHGKKASAKRAGV